MTADAKGPSVWSGLASSEGHVALRLATSLAALLLCAALGTIGAWLWSHLLGQGYTRDAHLFAGLSIGALVWILLLLAIWSRSPRGRHVVLPILLTCAVGLLTLLTLIVVDRATRDEDPLIGGTVLLAAGVVVLIWLPVIRRSRWRAPAVGADNLVRVHCPNCGYSLIGLRDLRCPECGLVFTLDEIIRAQHYT